MRQKRKITILVLLLIFSASSFAQEKKGKNYFPIWTFHQRNINIHGISLGIGSIRGKPRYTNTNGIKIEIIGAGIAMPLIPQSPVANSEEGYLRLKNEPISEKINGLSLSLTGTVCDCVTNGVSAGLVGQINYQVNGFSGSILMNFTQIHNGIQMAFVNESYYMNGLQIGAINVGHVATGIQIGIFNKSNNLKGIQIGLWNINQKRKLPLINWNFK